MHVQAYYQKIEDLERRLEIVQHSNLNISQDMEKIRHESLPHHNNQVHCLQEEVSQLEKLLALKEEECSVLKVCRKKLKNERQALERMLCEKEKEVQQLNKRLEERQTMLVEVKEHIMHLEEEILKKEYEIKEKAELEQKLKQELEVLKNLHVVKAEEDATTHHQSVTKVLIPNISSKFSKEELASYLERLMHKCEVEFHHSDAVVTFQYPIGMLQLNNLLCYIFSTLNI